MSDRTKAAFCAAFTLTAAVLAALNFRAGDPGIGAVGAFTAAFCGVGAVIFAKDARRGGPW